MASAPKTIDISSPYFLDTGDQPGNLISHVILKGDNYISWSRSITLSLKARRKFSFVGGSIVKPTTSTELLDWDTVNSMIVSWIMRTLDPKVATSIPFHDSARTLWLYLEKCYCIANGPRLQQLRAQITDCRQSKSMSVEDYFNHIMGLYDELERLKPLHICTCGLCTCNVVDKFRHDRDEEKLHQFYIGIDDDLYGAVRTNLLSQTPSPDLESAYQTFLQEERSRSIARTKPSTIETRAFALTGDRSRQRSNKSHLVCTHCKKRGHDRSGCFVLNGFPDWWIKKYGPPKAPASSSHKGRAHAHHTIGSGLLPLPHGPHSAAGPPVTTHGPAAGPSTSSASLPSHSTSMPLLYHAQVTSSHNPTMSDTISDDRMIGKYHCSDWIIDTGASHHVTGNYSCLFDLLHIFEWTIGLPDVAVFRLLLVAVLSCLPILLFPMSSMFRVLAVI
ncbi:Retrovirus-related Pol polyprotein from transposon RE1 [Bienertia sinuspersici]